MSKGLPCLLNVPEIQLAQAKAECIGYKLIDDMPPSINMGCNEKGTILGI